MVHLSPIRQDQLLTVGEVVGISIEGAIVIQMTGRNAERMTRSRVLGTTKEAAAIAVTAAEEDKGAAEETVVTTTGTGSEMAKTGKTEHFQ
jgi:hypothetical protein